MNARPLSVIDALGTSVEPQRTAVVEKARGRTVRARRIGCHGSRTPRCEESNVGQTMGMWNRNGTEEKSFSRFGVARLYDCIESRRGMLRPSSRSGSREGVAIPRRAFT
jgi:hypothetical protein